MPDAKICGITSVEALDAAIEASIAEFGRAYLTGAEGGFLFQNAGAA